MKDKRVEKIELTVKGGSPHYIELGATVVGDLGEILSDGTFFMTFADRLVFEGLSPVITVEWQPGPAEGSAGLRVYQGQRLFEMDSDFREMKSGDTLTLNFTTSF